MRFQHAAILGMGLALAGCEQDEVKVYEVAKERPVPGTAAGRAPAPPRPSQEAAAPGESRVPWTVPNGWTEKPTTGGMRLASYAITAPDGRTVDVSVVALGEQAGSELDNVNRWRRELELPPIEEPQLGTVRTAVPVGRATAFLYDQTSSAPLMDGKLKKRTLATILPAGGMTVFFKAMGEAALVEQEKVRYLAWLASVKAGPDADEPGASPAATTTPTATTTTAAAAAATAGGAVATASDDGLPSWKAPAHWKAGGPRPMRLASFEVPGDGEPGDVSVSQLSGGGGGLLSNVNRWRGQVGLAPLDDAGLARESTPLTLHGGRKGTLVDLGGAGPKRILGAIVPDGDKTWFFKLTAPDALARREKQAFVGWVQSMTW